MKRDFYEMDGMNALLYSEQYEQMDRCERCVFRTSLERISLNCDEWNFGGVRSRMSINSYIDTREYARDCALVPGI